MSSGEAVAGIVGVTVTLGFPVTSAASLIETASGIVLIAAGAAVLIRRRKRHNRQTYVIIDGRIYAKVQLGTVNQLIQNIELMQAIQELSRLTGLDMTAAEKIVRRWDSYWY